MILTLSPYYINIPFVSPLTGLTCSQYTLRVFVWQGLKTDAPSEPTYVITKANPEQLTTVDKVDIGRLVNSLTEFELKDVAQTELINGGSGSWVKTEIYYKTTDASEAELPQSQIIQLATKGYGNGIMGENQQTPTNKVLMDAREFKVYKNSKVVIPILIDESVIPTPSLTIDNITADGGDFYTVSYTYVGSYSNLFLHFYEAVGMSEFYSRYIDDVTGTFTFSFTGTGEYEFKLYGFDNNTGDSITSAPYIKTL